MSTIIQPIYDQLEELLKPVKENLYKAISVSITVSDGKVLSRTTHIYDRDHSGVSPTYEEALRQMTEEKEKDLRKLEAAKAEVARLEKKLLEQP